MEESLCLRRHKAGNKINYLINIIKNINCCQVEALETIADSQIDVMDKFTNAFPEGNSDKQEHQGQKWDLSRLTEPDFEDL